MSVHPLLHTSTGNHAKMHLVTIYAIAYQMKLTLLAKVAMKITSTIVATAINEQCKFSTLYALHR